MAPPRLAAVLLLCAALAPPGVPARHVSPFFLGWKALGELHLTKDGCANAPCVLTIRPERRHRMFALATDSPLPVTLTGDVGITCGDGVTFSVFLQSSGAPGIFQVIGNSCNYLDVNELRLKVTSVGLLPGDGDHGVFITVYGGLS